MNKYQVYKSLRRHVKLAEDRSILSESNKFAKFLTYIGVFCLAVYIMFFSVILSLAANSVREFTPCQFLFGFIPFILSLDYVARIFGQRTPAQMIKPYLLLPLRKYDCVDSFMFSAIVTPNNLMWLFLTIPYCIMSVVFSAGFFSAVSFVVTFQLLIICNSFIYMFTRTLFYRHMLYCILPFAFYALLFSPWYISDFDTLVRFYSKIGEWAEHGSLLMYIGIVVMLMLLFLLNRRIQYRNIMSETVTEKDLKLKTISSFSVFDRFHQTGEYLKIELKSLLRNKNTRSMFVNSIIFVVILSLLNSFTDFYESDGFSFSFWSVYPFVLMSMSLVRIMSPEGNYIECLLVHKENIRSLLEAKYYFYTVLQLLPLLLMLPTVFTGKYSFLMLLAMMLFTAGPMYCVLMQLAVTNKVSIPLNTKLTRKNGMETNYMQLVAEMVVMFMPILILKVFLAVMGETLAYIVMVIIGVTFIALHKLWIGNIYTRMMKRKYINLEGFMTSR